MNEPKELALLGVYQAGPNSLVEKIGQTSVREGIACFLGGTGSKMVRRWNRNGNLSDIHRIIGIRADLVYSTRPKQLTDFIVLSTGDVALFSRSEPHPLLSRAEESDPN